MNKKKGKAKGKGEKLKPSKVLWRLGENGKKNKPFFY